MGNSYDLNRKIALAHVSAEQIKGYVLAKSKQALIILSGLQLFAGVTLTTGDIHLRWEMATLYAVLAALPVALIAGFLAMIIEAGTIFTSAVLRDINNKIEAERQILAKKARAFTEKEMADRRRKIERKRVWPLVLMLVCIVFSVAGAELFWQRILEGHEWYYHIIGGIMGLVCSTLLVLFEMKTDMIERLIENAITSSALIQQALDMSAKAQIHEAVFEAQTAYMLAPEVKDALNTAVQGRMHGILAKTVQAGGASVTAEQLAREIRRVREERAAADIALESGPSDVLGLPAPVTANAPVAISVKRKNKHRKVVEDLVARYGVERVAEEAHTFANEKQMDVRTLEAHLNAIASGA